MEHIAMQQFLLGCVKARIWWMLCRASARLTCVSCVTLAQRQALLEAGASLTYSTSEKGRPPGLESEIVVLLPEATEALLQRLVALASLPLPGSGSKQTLSSMTTGLYFSTQHDVHGRPNRPRRCHRDPRGQDGAPRV